MGLDLRKFYYDNNFKYDKGLNYGIYKDRAVSIIEKGMYVKVSVSFSTPLEKENGMQISAKMTELKAKQKALQKALTTNVSLELIIYKSADANEEFFAIMNEAFDILDIYHPACVEKCALCGQTLPSNAPFVKIKDTILQAHDACINQLIEASSKMGEDLLVKFDKKAFWKSFFAALLLFSVIVAIICLVSYFGGFGFVSVLSGWLFFFIYRIVLRKIKVQVRQQELILSLVFTVLTAVLSIYLGSMIVICITSKISFLEVFKNYFLLLKENFDALAKPIILYLVLSLAFSCPSIIIGISQIKHKLSAIKKL